MYLFNAINRNITVFCENYMSNIILYPSLRQLFIRSKFTYYSMCIMFNVLMIISCDNNKHYMLLL